MDCNKNEIILYGLNDYLEYVDKIIKNLNLFDYYFEIKLILTEALTNAFQYGNKNDKSKPIYLRYYVDGKRVVFEIEDSGRGIENVDIPDCISDKDLYKENGRGLFLIKCFADEVQLNGNILSISKYV